LFADAHEDARQEDPTVGAMATSPLNVDRVCAWQEEARRAVRQRELLPPAACEAIARVLERFLDEMADEEHEEEMRTAVALLLRAARRSTHEGTAAALAGGRKTVPAEACPAPLARGTSI
jgi:hypothetical protein